MCILYSPYCVFTLYICIGIRYVSFQDSIVIQTHLSDCFVIDYYWLFMSLCIILILEIYFRYFDPVNPKLGRYINWRCPRAARSHIWLLRQPIGEREVLRHASAIVGSSRPTLRKSWRPWGRLQNCLVRQLLAGEVPGPGVVVEGVLEGSYKPSKPPEIYKNVGKTASFPH
jgi:hypothetical protein